jgi:hypothetical protein
MKGPREVGENYSWRIIYISHVEESTIYHLSYGLKIFLLKSAYEKQAINCFIRFWCVNV